MTVVAVSTIFLKMFGSHNWMYLTMFLSAFPLVACFMFCTSPMPDVDISQNQGSKSNKKRTIGMGLCVGCIFLGSAAENVMTNWISGYMENALNISKSIGDIFGMALFAVLLGCVRTLYAKYGRNISNVLLFGMLGAAICYVTAGLCRNTIVGMIACIATGICTSMLWPGTLIYMEEKITGPGVAAYALMAAGGDFGASIAPQMMGIIVDNVSVSQWAIELSKTVSLTAEQIGMKVGMLIAAIFPIMGVLLILVMKKYFAKES